MGFRGNHQGHVPRPTKKGDKLTLQTWSWEHQKTWYRIHWEVTRDYTSHNHKSHTVDFRSAPDCCPVPVESANDGGIHCQLCSAAQWQAINSHFESCIRPICDLQIQITDQNVRGDASPRLVAHSGSDTCQGETSFAQNPCPRCWPKTSGKWPHRQSRTVRGRGNWKRRNRSTLKI